MHRRTPQIFRNCYRRYGLHWRDRLYPPKPSELHERAIWLFLPVVQSVNPVAVEIHDVLVETEQSGQVLVDGITQYVAEEAAEVPDLMEEPHYWQYEVAQNVLRRIEDTIIYGHECMGPTMSEALRKAADVASEVFAILFEEDEREPNGPAQLELQAVVGFGVLALLYPPFVELMGFSEDGPVDSRTCRLFFFFFLFVSSNFQKHELTTW